MNLTPYQAAFVNNNLEKPVLYGGPVSSGKTVALVSKALEMCRAMPNTLAGLIDASGMSMTHTFQTVLRKEVPGYTSGNEVHFGNGSLLRIRDNLDQFKGYHLDFLGIDNAHYYNELPFDAYYRTEAYSGLFRLTATTPTPWIKEKFLGGVFPYYLADEHNPYVPGDIYKGLEDVLDTPKFHSYFTLAAWQ